MNAAYRGFQWLGEEQRRAIICHTLPRDAQRQRLYRWERSAIGRGDKLPVLQAIELVAAVWVAECARYGRAGVPVPEVVVSRRNRPSAAHACAMDHQIVLGVIATCKEVILHEVAHMLSPAEEAHGPRFVGILIGLLSRHLQHDAQALLRSALAAGLRV